MTELVGVDFRNITHPDDVGAGDAQFRQVLAGTIDSYHMEKRYFRKDGSIAHGALSVAVVRDLSGNAVHFVAQIADICDRKAAELALAKVNSRLSLAMGLIEGGFWHYDIATALFEPSEQFARLVGGPTASVRNFLQFSSLFGDSDKRAASLKELIAGKAEEAVAEYRVRTYDEKVRWFRCHRQLIRDSDGLPEQVIGIVIDVTLERERHAELHEFASTDTLTGLLNRRGMVERTSDFVPRLRGSQICAGVIMLDLDHFKHVNDQHGHDAGDAVLVETGKRLQALFRPADAIVRLGGDEFAVILNNTSKTDATSAVKRVLASMQQCYGYKGRLLSVGTSAGVAIQNHKDYAFPDLLARADRALYAAKQAGRGIWRIAA